MIMLIMHSGTSVNQDTIWGCTQDVLDVAHAGTGLSSLWCCLQINEDTLEDVLLFVGILSGRGYRHRRLAVREAWANQCQMPGVSVCRFMLSEDEVTPQVCASACAREHSGAHE